MKLFMVEREHYDGIEFYDNCTIGVFESKLKAKEAIEFVRKKNEEYLERMQKDFCYDDSKYIDRVINFTEEEVSEGDTVYRAKWYIGSVLDEHPREFYIYKILEIDMDSIIHDLDDDDKMFFR